MCNVFSLMLMQNYVLFYLVAVAVLPTVTLPVNCKQKIGASNEFLRVQSNYWVFESIGAVLSL